MMVEKISATGIQKTENQYSSQIKIGNMKCE